MKRTLGRKLFCIILCFTMILSQVSAAFAAAEGTSLEERAIDMSAAWDSEKNQWKVSESNYETFLIRTAEDWLAFADCVNAGKTLSGKTVKLTNDLNLEAETDLVPVGCLEVSSSSQTALSVAHPFSGTFDGQGFEIKGIVFDDTKNEKLKNLYSIGLFGYVKDALIKDVILCGTISVTNDLGGGKSNFGGVGAAVGDAAGNTTLQNVVNCCNVSNRSEKGYPTASGLVGRIYHSASDAFTLVNCVNEGDITANSSKGYASGLVGLQSGTAGAAASMKGCINMGTVTGASKKTSAIAYSSKMFPAGIAACYNTCRTAPLFAVAAEAVTFEQESMVTLNADDAYGNYVADVNSWKTAWVLNNSSNGVMFTINENKLERTAEDSPALFRIEVKPYDTASNAVTASAEEINGVLYSETNSAEGTFVYYGTAGMKVKVTLTGQNASEDPEEPAPAVYPVYTTTTNKNGEHGIGSSLYTDNTQDVVKVITVPVTDKNISIQYGSRADYEKTDDYTWYNPTASKYYIGTPGQLKALRNLVNSGIDFKGKTIELTADIDVTEAEVNWTPIGNASKTPFKGIFIGGNHQVYYEITSDRTTTYGALFGYIDGAKIENLIVSGKNRQSANYAAGIAADAGNSTIRNCTNKVTVDIGAKQYCAGVVCQADDGSLIENCINEASIAAKQYAAGIVYKLTGSTIKGCTNGSEEDSAAGEITVTDLYAAGIVGTSTGNKEGTFTEISDCINYGTISAAKGYSGGIIYTYAVSGVIETPQVVECINYGSVKSTGITTDNYPAGGIAAKFEGYMLNCENHGDVEAKSMNKKAAAGGIVGYLAGKAPKNAMVLVENCRNTGDVVGVYAGGISGINYLSTADFRAEILKCKNTGTVSKAGSSSVIGEISGCNIFNASKAAEMKITSCVSYPSALAENTETAAVGGSTNYTAGTHTLDYDGIYYLSSNDKSDAEHAAVQALTKTSFKSSVLAKNLNKAANEEFWGYNPDAEEGCSPVVFNGFADYPVLEIQFVPFSDKDRANYTVTLMRGDENLTLNENEGTKYYDIKNGFTAEFSISDAEEKPAKYIMIDAGDVSDLLDAQNIEFTASNSSLKVYYGSEENYENFVYDDWYSVQKKEFMLTTAGQLKSFANLVNSGKSFSGMTVSLGDNIALSGICSKNGETWVPIGNSDANKFKGTFDGKGYTISGIYIDSTEMASGSNVGLFGYLQGAVIRNLSIADSEIATPEGKTTVSLGAVGMLAGSSKEQLLIENVSVGSDVTVKVPAYAVAGIIGEVEAFNPTNADSAVGKDTIVTRAANHAKVVLMESDSVIKAHGTAWVKAAGGIIGYSKWGYQTYGGNESLLSYSWNTGEIINEASLADTAKGYNAAGGVIGFAYSSHTSATNSTSYLPVTLCYNTGNITANSEEGRTQAAGILGFGFGVTTNGTVVGVYTANITNTFNTGIINAENKGGILTYPEAIGNVSNNYYKDNFGDDTPIDKAMGKVDPVDGESIAAGALAYMLDNGSMATRSFKFMHDVVNGVASFILDAVGEPVFKITVNVAGIGASEEVMKPFAEDVSEMQIGAEGYRIIQYFSKGRTETVPVTFHVTPPAGFILGKITVKGAVDGCLEFFDFEVRGEQSTEPISVNTDLTLTIDAGQDLTMNLEYIEIPEDYGQMMNAVLYSNTNGEPGWLTREGHKAESVTVGFRNGDRLTEAALNTAVNSTATSTTPRRSGYKFTAWYTEPECSNAFEYNQILTGYNETEQPLNLYAGWEKIDTVLLNLHSNGSADAAAQFAETLYEGEQNPDRSVYVLEAEVNTPASILENYIPEREGYTFAGWFYDENTHLLFTDEELISGADLYAGWITDEECLIHFDGNAGYFTADSGKSKIYIVKVEKAMPESYPEGDLQEAEGAEGEVPTEEEPVGAAPAAEVPINETPPAEEPINETPPAEEPINETPPAEEPEAEEPADKVLLDSGAALISENFITISELSIPTPKRDLEAGKAYNFEGWMMSPIGEFTITEISAPSVNTTIYAKWSMMEASVDEEGNPVTPFEQFMELQKNPDGSFNEVVINDYETLKAFAAYVNSGNDCAGMSFVLGSDIAVGDDWTQSIGSSGIVFKGTFDGGGHTIEYRNAKESLFGTVSGSVSNVSVSGSGTMSAGIVNTLEAGGMISDCSVKDGTVLTSVSGTMGGIVGTVNQGSPAIKITNCTVGDDVKLTGGPLTGGIVGIVRQNSTASVEISGCAVGTATITGSGSNGGVGGLGGIVGYGAGNISDCTVSATLTTGAGKDGMGIGGIIGCQQSEAGMLNISNSGFAGTIQIDGEGSAIGGIAGYLQGANRNFTVEINDTYSTGTINVASGTTIGGILGNNSYVNTSVTINNSYWHGTYNGEGEFSGIAAEGTNVTANNSYYYQDSGVNYGGVGTGKDESFFTSGEAAYTLNDGRTGDDAPWKQGAGMPGFDGKTVHKVTLTQDKITWENGDVTNITITSKDYTNADGSVVITGGTGNSVFVIDGETVEVEVDYVPPATTDEETNETTTYTVTVKFENSDMSFTFTSAGTQTSPTVDKNLSAGGSGSSSTSGEDDGEGGGEGGGSGAGAGTGSGVGGGNASGGATGEGTGNDTEGTDGDGTGDIEGDGTGESSGDGEPGTGDGDVSNESASNPLQPEAAQSDPSAAQPEVQPAPETETLTEQQPETEKPEESSDAADLSEIGSEGGQSGGGEQGADNSNGQIYKIIKKVTDTVKENPAATAAILAGILAIIAFGAWYRKKKEDREQ